MSESGKTMLNLAVRNTGKLVRERSKSDNIRLGRFFTKKETARLMAAMLELDENKTAYTILDPGAGTGILSAAVIEEICKRCPKCRQIFLTAYEVSSDFIAMLEDNLERIRKKCRHDYDVRLYVTVYNENYVTESQNHYTVTLGGAVEDKFDIIICNPPTELVSKDSTEAKRCGGVTQLKINTAYLFAKMASRHLEEGGKLVIMLPTAVASSSSLTEYRKEMAKTLSLEKVHLFIGKTKNEKRAVPLKKSLILAYAKRQAPVTITVTTSYDWGKPESCEMLPPLDYGFVVSESDGSLTLPKNVSDTRIVQYISSFPETLTSLGLKVSTGLVIDSRLDGMLFTDNIPGTLPLLRPQAIRRGIVRFPLPIKHQYIAPTKTLMQKNKNMVLIKRVPAKSDDRFVNSAIYLASTLPQYKYISTHNKLNFIDTKDSTQEMCPRLTFGIYALLNSTIYDRYLSILSKSKQINAKELRSLPLPPRNVIENIGVRLMGLRRYDVETCDSIVNPTLHIKQKN